MKVAVLNGSPHREGNISQLLEVLVERFLRNGIEAEVINVGHKDIHGCIACYKCHENRDEKCAIQDDVNGWIQKMKAADGIVLASPVYYSGIAGTFKSFLDRAFYVAGANGGLFRHKVGAALVALRRSGGVATFDQLNHYFGISEMPIAASNYWNAVHGAEEGEALQDAEGMQVVRVLADNMSWMLKLIENGKGRVEEPAREKKTAMNFIR
jgi:multimeric flavodoxin WrbA